MKNKIYLILNSFALIIAVIWLISSNYDYEPQIAIIGLIITLVTIMLSSPSKKNSVEIKGNRNTVSQKNTTIKEEKENVIRVEGDENDISQNI